MLAKLFQEFHPLGAAPKHAVADMRSSQEDRTGTTYHLDGLEGFGSDTTFGIFEAFLDVAARNAHDVGPGGQNFLRSAELDEMLAYPAHIYRLDVMLGKFSTLFGKKIA